jgi:hypothetical protein
MALKVRDGEIITATVSSRRSVRALALTVLAAVLATAMLMLSLPSVRAGAEALREFLRLGNCAAVVVDRDRFRRLCHRPS